MSAYERFPMDPAVAVDLYTRQCSINVSAHDLAVMGATLAFGGRNPVTGKQVDRLPATCPGLLAIMATAGMYDDSGKWLFRTGLPTKSGVGGGLSPFRPGKFGIGTFAPPLDAAGNSVRGQRAITDIVRAARRQSLTRNSADCSRHAAGLRTSLRSASVVLVSPSGSRRRRARRDAICSTTLISI